MPTSLSFFCAGVLLLTATSSHAHGPTEETVKPRLQQALPNVPGKQFTAVTVEFAPGAAAKPHRHGEAFVYAYVLAGTVRSQLEGEPAQDYRTGQSWHEPPGAHHTITRNLSRKRPARLLVVFIATPGDPLKVPDAP
ncbi:MAG: cupin domain-containing protein [Caldimonas sp.]